MIGVTEICSLSPARCNVGPTDLSFVTLTGALRWTEALVRARGHHYFCFCEANLLSIAARDRNLARVLKHADAVFLDGIALALLAKLHGHEPTPRISGPSFMLAACEYGVPLGWRHFFYGGEPGVAERLAANLQSRFPSLLVAGYHSPPFRELTTAEEADVRQRIESSGADLLWVGLGGPKQEFWCADHVGKIDVPVMLGVGAAFDFHSGRRPWAPAWVRAMGMEWLFRTVTGGRRTFLRNLRCLAVVSTILLRAAWSRAVGNR